MGNILINCLYSKKNDVNVFIYQHFNDDQIKVNVKVC